MWVPKNVKTLRSFLGLVSHYSTFLPELWVWAHLNNLLKKYITLDFSFHCQLAFTKVKFLLSSDLLLTHYNLSMDIVVVSDASNYGIGAVIFHVLPDGSQKAIAYASRSLTPVECNYSQKCCMGTILLWNFFQCQASRRSSSTSDNEAWCWKKGWILSSVHTFGHFAWWKCIPFCNSRSEAVASWIIEEVTKSKHT